jgi:hypothetical protein
MNDARARAMDMAFGGGSAGPTAGPEETAAPEESEGGMTCPVCGAKFKVESEAPVEASAAPEGMGGM